MIQLFLFTSSSWNITENKILISFWAFISWKAIEQVFLPNFPQFLWLFPAASPYFLLPCFIHPSLLFPYILRVIAEIRIIFFVSIVVDIQEPVHVHVYDHKWKSKKHREQLRKIKTGNFIQMKEMCQADDGKQLGRRDIIRNFFRKFTSIQS